MAESYATVEGIALTFRRVATRAPVAAGVLGAEEDLLENEEQFSKLFAEFFPELVEFSETWNTEP
ncbi:MAG: ACP phosphodiesterase [Akkermansiaceae bacterium]|nr:ACP phosphodiesterase [Akkermansiaceae bacterium]